MAGKVPEVYMQIFPPKPEPQSLEPAPKEAADGDDNATTGGATAPVVAGSASETEKEWAQEFVQQVKSVE